MTKDDVLALVDLKVDNLIDHYMDPKNGLTKVLFSWTMFANNEGVELVYAQIVDVIPEAFESILKSLIRDIFKAKINQNRHLPVSTLQWLKRPNTNRSIYNWTYQTIEGESNYSIKGYCKQNRLEDLNFYEFIAKCTLPEHQWDLMRAVSHSFIANRPFSLEYENKVVLTHWKIKPKNYTFDKDHSTHHLGWFIRSADVVHEGFLLRRISEQLTCDYSEFLAKLTIAD